MSTIPSVAIILFLVILLIAFVGIILSSPIVSLCENRNTAITDRKIPKILREYFKKESRSCQGYDNHDADVNETLPHNVNEENIDLVIT